MERTKKIDKIHWNPGNLIFPLGNNTLRLYQPHYRRNFLISSQVMPLIDALAASSKAGVVPADIKHSWNASWMVKDATTFTLYDHAYANSAMFDEDASLGLDDKMGFDDAISFLVNAGFLATTWPIEYNHQKTHFGEMFKGSFYEQIGTTCLMERRQPTEWWTDQKFEDDRLSTRDTAYKFIQDKFLDEYLKRFVENKSIIEVGCGTGYYTNRMAQVAKKAVGVDYNEDYVDVARKTWPQPGQKSAIFGVLDIIDFSTKNPGLIEEQYDFVIMIDTFLFLFHETYQAELYNNRFKVLQNLARLIHKNGRILIMDPHPLFLTPFFGDENRPFGILESYNSHYFRVIPTMAEITELLSSSGLAISRITEPKPHADFKDVNSVSHNFYSEVPMWQMMEIVPI